MRMLIKQAFTERGLQTEQGEYWVRMMRDKSPACNYNSEHGQVWKFPEEGFKLSLEEFEQSRKAKSSWPLRPSGSLRVTKLAL